VILPDYKIQHRDKFCCHRIKTKQFAHEVNELQFSNTNASFKQTHAQHGNGFLITLPVFQLANGLLSAALRNIWLSNPL